MARRKKQDEDPSQDNVNNSDDTFGLPEIEYEPLDREESPKTEEPESPSQPTSEQTETHTEMDREEVQQNEYNTNYNDEEEGNSPWPKILGIAAFLLVTAGVVWYFVVYRPKEQKAAQEKARQEQEAADKQRVDELAEQKRLEDERRRADSLATIATPTAGEINTLTERTGRYYVVIASGIDGDLIMDYAKKLAPKGVSPKIIPPYGSVKFYRLTIAEGDTYASTQATADQLKGEYGDGAWVIKY